MIENDNIIPSTMTNFERNMRNATQQRNKTRVMNALKSIDAKYDVETVNDYVFIKVFSILGTEIGIAPDGTMETTAASWTTGENEVFENTDEVIEFVETYRSY